MVIYFEKRTPCIQDLQKSVSSIVKNWLVKGSTQVSNDQVSANDVNHWFSILFVNVDENDHFCVVQRADGRKLAIFMRKRELVDDFVGQIRCYSFPKTKRKRRNQDKNEEKKKKEKSHSQSQFNAFVFEDFDNKRRSVDVVEL